MGKRILIVDDEESVAFFLSENLSGLEAGYEVETALSGPEALARMAPRPFDLLITDLRMPGMDGLGLIKRVRALHPDTRLILMTAFGDPQVEATAYRLGACRYITKPFSVDALMAAVRTALAAPEAPGRDILVLSDERFEDIARCLADLRFEVAAQCILLAGVSSQLIANVGEVEHVDLPGLVSLIGGGFATSQALSRQLGENRALTLNYHEGEHYDLYSSNVNAELFVVLLFDKRIQHSKIGMVWLYTRRALDRLHGLVASEKMSASQVFDADFGAQLSDSLDQLWAPSTPQPTTSAQPAPTPARAARPAIEAPVAQDPARAAPASARPPATPDTGGAPASAPRPATPPEAEQKGESETFDLQQALNLGLLDPYWLQTLSGNDKAE